MVWLLVSLFAAAQAVTLDRVAATIDNQVVTRSELEQAVALRIVARVPDEDAEDYLGRVLDHLIEHRLQYRDAQRFGQLADVPDAEVAAGMQSIRGRFPAPQDLDMTIVAVGLSVDDLREMLRQRAQVRAYVRERLAPLVFVSLDEIETHYRDVWAPAHTGTAGTAPPLSAAREEIRETLRSERLAREIANWTAQLRARAEVEIYVFR